MEYKSIDFVAFLSGLFGAASALGVVVLNFGPWGAQPSGQTARLILTISWLAFGMVSIMASNVAKILTGQADQIAALQRQLAER